MRHVAVSSGWSSAGPTQHAPEVRPERPPVLIAPLVTDDERHRAAGTQRATHLLIGRMPP
jgi:hypothetical protein